MTNYCESWQRAAKTGGGGTGSRWPLPDPPFCARSRNNGKISKWFRPWSALFSQGPPPPCSLHTPQPRSQALSSWEGNNHRWRNGVATVALFFAESDRRQPGRDGWRISNILVPQPAFPVPIFWIVYGQTSVWSLFCDTENVHTLRIKFCNKFFVIFHGDSTIQVIVKIF
jgi:hypothetical protein